jgi:hypothetical protein
MYAWHHASSTSRSGTWPTRSTWEWAVTYSSSTGAGGSLAPLTTTSTQPVTVREIQALVTDQ